jgi:DNA-binding NarL/FixJ family response regulator
VAHLNGDTVVLVCVARHLGDAAVLLGDRTAARGYYMRALHSAGKIRFRPELALIHLSIAELLVAEGEDTAAVEHLELAIPELGNMQMQLGVERALNLLGQVEQRAAPAPTLTAEGTQVLTKREREVARLLAAGRSNREIADKLVITEGTVEVHVKHILSKLGCRSRAQVAAWAADERV